MVFSFVFFVGSLLAATATASEMVIIGRAVQGIGGAGIVNGAFMTIAAAGPEGSKPSMSISPVLIDDWLLIISSLCLSVLVGVAVTLGTVGSITGPMIGGALTEISWRWCMYIPCPMNLLAWVSD